jgi:hypothetical protein
MTESERPGPIADTSATTDSTVSVRRKRHALLIVVFMLFVGAWIMVNPPWGTIDEPAHFVKGIGTASGDVLGKKLSPSQRAEFLSLLNNTETQRRRAAFLVSTGRRFDFSSEKAAKIPNIPCFVRQKGSAANCHTVNGRLRQFSYVGSYPPPYYFIVGTPANLIDDPVTGLRASRAVSAGLCVLLLGIAVVATWRPRRPNLGLLLGITPMTLFLAASVQSSALEVCGTVAFTALILAIAREGMTLSRTVGAVLVGGLLAWSRPLGALWIGLTLVLVAAWKGRERAVALWRDRRSQFSVVSLVAISAGAVAWEVTAGFRAPSRHQSALTVINNTISEMTTYIGEQIGVFNWLDVRLPGLAYGLWWLVTIGFLAVAVWGVRNRVRILIVGILAFYFIGVIALAVEYAGTGYHFEGRYVLPLWSIAMLMIGEMLAESAFDWRSTLGKGLLSVVGGLFALINLWAIFVEGHRYAVGAHGPHAFWNAPLWSPPGGWWPWLLMAIAGAGAMIAWTVLIVRDLRARPVAAPAG